MPNADEIDVFMFCDSYMSGRNHYGHAGYLSKRTDKWSLGEVVSCDWMDGYEWFCPLNMDMNKWTSFYNNYCGTTHMFSRFGHGDSRENASKNQIPTSQLGFYWNGSEWLFYEGCLFIAMTEYSSQIDYTVVHEYYTNDKFDGKSDSSVSGGQVDDVIKVGNIPLKKTYNNKTYNPTTSPNVSITLVEDASKNVITVRYDRTTYQVEWYDDDGNYIKAPETRDSTAEVNEEVSVTDADKEVKGYTFNENNPKNNLTDNLVKDGSTTLKLYFNKGSNDKNTTYTLTVKYVYENGDTAARTYTESLNSGDSYSVSSPAINGYTPDKVLVSGIMPAGNMEYTVVYKAVNNPRPNPPEPNEPEPIQPVAEITYIPYTPVVDVLMAGVPGDVVDIAETNVPLAAAPNGVVDIFDTDVPLAAVPKTGDLSQLWYVAAILSAAGLLMMAALGRRERKQHKEK